MAQDGHMKKVNCLPILRTLLQMVTQKYIKQWKYDIKTWIWTLKYFRNLAQMFSLKTVFSRIPCFFSFCFFYPFLFPLLLNDA